MSTPPALLGGIRIGFSGFTALALQDPGSAADELERAVGDMGFKGALINGYSNTGYDEAVMYLDEQPMWEFWERVSKLDVPVYLHPREPLSSQTPETMQVKPAPALLVRLTAQTTTNAAFTVSSPSTPYNIPAGQSAAIMVVFQPTAYTVYDATLSIVTSGGTLTTPLSGA